ncbi:MAG TPA: GNAT family N-acetyltransferase [Streptosporangiaceae bacterium]|nr:GNAT family N-acetyltransferase [Streptosporangiaceae bacterium]
MREVEDGRSRPARPERPGGLNPPAGLALRMDQNLAEHSTHLHRGTPGMAVRETADLLIADSGLDDDSVNFVGAARFTAATAAARIAETIAEVEATGRPFAWRVGPTSTPAGLRVLLADAGLPATETEPAMWAPLRDTAGPGTVLADTVFPGAVPRGPVLPGTVLPGAVLPGTVLPGPGGLDIRLVGSAAELRDWSWVLAAGSDPLGLALVEFFARTASRVLTPDCPARLLVGYSGGRPVCTAEVMLYAGVAGLYNISTLMSHQRRGFGTAITKAALQVARQLGADTAVLQSSEQGEPLYRRLGFAAFGEVTEHPFPR